MEKKIIREGKEVGAMIQVDGKWVLKEAELTSLAKQRIADMEKALLKQKDDIISVLEDELKLKGTALSFRVESVSKQELRLALCLKIEGGMGEIIDETKHDPRFPGYIRIKDINTQDKIKNRLQTAMDKFISGFTIWMGFTAISISIDYSEFK